MAEDRPVPEHAFTIFQRTERVVVAPLFGPRAPVPVDTSVDVQALTERVYRLMLDDLTLRRERD